MFTKLSEKTIDCPGIYADIVPLYKKVNGNGKLEWWLVVNMKLDWCKTKE